MALKTMILSTSGATQTLTVPSDWNSTNNTVVAIGAGVHGGGAYAGIVNLALTPGGTCAYRIAAGLTATGDAGDTWISNTGSAPASTSQGVLADGANGTTGGQASASIGINVQDGGNAGTGDGFGGGGAGGPFGPGGNGGNSSSTSGGGGGGADGGENGNTDGVREGGDGRSGVGGGTGAITGFPAGNGSDGGGGGGDLLVDDIAGKGLTSGVGPGGAGSMEALWVDNSGGPNNGVTAGPGGGGGGGQNGTATDTNGGAGGLYGGGGGDDDAGDGTEGAGRQGVIVLIWEPATAAATVTRVVGVIA